MNIPFLNNLLVLGGTGSFGGKVATKLAPKVGQVTIFSRDEKKQDDMRRRHPDFRYVIGDVRDRDALQDVMHGQDVVFYAAALKQVPSCELHPMEALKTNCLGVDNACRVAWSSKTIRKFVYLSTDKAVEPVNAMGISKAMAEKIVTSQRAGGPAFCVTRYGNVMGTRGSVLPVWFKQFRDKVPITITDELMTRFVMNLHDSVDLVEHALQYGQNQQTFVWLAPATYLTVLAKVFLEHLNEPNYPWTVTGRRPGEKLHETLIGLDELHRTEFGQKYALIHKDPIVTSKEYVRDQPFTSAGITILASDLAVMVDQAMCDIENAL